MDGDLGDLDPNPGAEADPAACPWESPSAELLPPPRLSQPPGSQPARCRKTRCLTSGGRKAVSLRKVHFSSLI